MEKRNVTYEREMGRNYLILPLEDEPGYGLRMVEANQIPGLLPLSIRRMNGRAACWYDISSLQPLSTLFEHGMMRGEDVTSLLRALQALHRELSAYLLEDEGLLLDPDLVYLDPDRGISLFCYGARTGDGQAEELGAFVLRRLNHTDPVALRQGYAFYAAIREGSEGMWERLGEILEETPDRSDEARQVEQSSLFEEQPDLFEEQPDLFQEEPAFLEEGKKRRRPGASARKVAGWVLLAGTLGGVYFSALRLFALTLPQAGALASALGAGSFALFRLLGARKGGGTEPARAEEEDFLRILTAEDYDPQLPEGSGRWSAPASPSIQTPSISLHGGKPATDPPRGDAAPAEEGSGLTECMLLPGATQAGEHPKGQPCLKSQSRRLAGDILLREGSLLIGKKAGQTDVCIPHRTISRIHARVSCVRGEVRITDLNSTNGTFVNQVRLRPQETVPLQEGDQVRLADLTFTVRLQGAPGLS